MPLLKAIGASEHRVVLDASRPHVHKHACVDICFVLHHQ
jgi:hypothetical protein